MPLGTTLIGKVIVPAKLESLEDLLEVRVGKKSAEQVRVVEVSDALVDAGATMLSMPKRFIDQLGLKPRRTRRARTAGGVCDFNIYDSVQLTVQGRDCVVEVSELPDDCPVLIGQIPLEILDWVVDPVGQRLIGNPAHNGEQMIELYSWFAE